MDSAHYPGDCSVLEPDQVYGPDTAKAYYIATGATYDPEKDRTTITFKPYLGDRYGSRGLHWVARTK